MRVERLLPASKMRRIEKVVKRLRISDIWKTLISIITSTLINFSTNFVEFFFCFALIYLKWENWEYFKTSCYRLKIWNVNDDRVPSGKFPIFAGRKIVFPSLKTKDEEKTYSSQMLLEEVLNANFLLFFSDNQNLKRQKNELMQLVLVGTIWYCNYLLRFRTSLEIQITFCYFADVFPCRDIKSDMYLISYSLLSSLFICHLFKRPKVNIRTF